MKIFFTALLVIVLILCGFVYDYFKFTNQSVGVGDENRLVTITPGMTFNEISTVLQQGGFVKNKLYWKILAIVRGQADALQAGEYELSYSLNPIQILDKLAQGITKQYSITIVEGWTFAKLWDEVKQHKKIKQTVEAPDALMKALSSSYTHPEGLFFPDTYYFSANTTDIEFFTRPYQTMISKLETAWEKRNTDTILKNNYEALILASIIEKETAISNEKPLVAAVFLQRLNKGMKLETDPTVIYGMGQKFLGNIKRNDLQANTPYNTYVHKGLTPTPISLPGWDSIYAAVRPAQSRALFFVAKGDGTHHFSETYEEHQQAVNEYQLKRH